MTRTWLKCNSSLFYWEGFNFVRNESQSVKVSYLGSNEKPDRTEMPFAGLTPDRRSFEIPNREIFDIPRKKIKTKTLNE